MQLPSIDVFIGLIFLFGIGYGFILQRDRTITYLCSVYIGIVIASNFSQNVFDFFNGNKVIANQLWIRSNLSLSTISIAILLISVFFVSGAINSQNKKAAEISATEVLVYSALTVALVISSVLGFLPEAQRNGYLDSSKIASIIYSYRNLLIVVPPIMLIILNWRRR